MDELEREPFYDSIEPYLEERKERRKKMPNGRYVINDLDFENKIKEMCDRELQEFTARLSYSNAIRIISLEGKDKKMMGTVGGISAVIGATIVTIANYLLGR